MPRILLLILFLTILTAIGFFFIQRITYDSNTTYKSSGDIAGVTDYALSDYWPQPIGAFWKFKQYQGSQNKFVKTNCPVVAKSVFYVTPPDLLFRGISSRSIENYKTHDCMWNWSNAGRSANWLVSFPLLKKANMGIASHFMRQAGVRIMDSNTGEVVGTQTNFKLPFASTESYLKHTGFSAALSGTADTFKSGSLDATRGQEPYMIFPYNNTVQGTVTNTGYFKRCPTRNPRQAVNNDLDNCNDDLSKVLETYAWDTKATQVPISSIKQEIPLVANATGNALKMTFLEIGALNDGSQASKRFEFINEYPSVNESNIGWVACENWYFVKDLGVVKIDAIAFTRNTDPTVGAVLTDLEQFKVSRNLGSSHTLSREVITAWCNELDFDTKFLKKSSRLVLESTNVAQIKAQVPAHQRASSSFLDSPDAASTVGSGSVMFIDKGRYYIFNFNQGKWVSIGDLSTAWSKIYGVTVNGQQVKPWDYKNSGNKTALAWAPEFLDAWLPRISTAYTPTFKSAHQPKQIVFNNGAYWVYGQGSNTWGCNTNSSGTCLSSAQGITGNAAIDLQKIQTAPVFTYSGGSITPFKNGGPDAIDVTPDGNALIILNHGISWLFNKDGTWTLPVNIQSTQHFRNAPLIGGMRPYYPEALVQFRQGEYITNVRPGETPTQQVLFSKGGVWVNYNGAKWETSYLNVSPVLP